MGWITKEQMWNYLKNPQTTREEAYDLLEQFAEYMFERGWKNHQKLRKGILSWEAKKMKEDFDEVYDRNIDKFPLKILDKFREVYYNHIPQTHSPK
jgi:hypothetical protein